MTGSLVGVIDTGCCNLSSIENALDAIGHPHTRASTPSDIERLDRLLLPGVGHFGHAVRCLDERGLRRAIEIRVAQGARLLGICLGMQLLFEESDESPGTPGLGLLPGHIGRLDASREIVPHTGWNRVTWRPGDRTTDVYFVHGYALAEWPAGRSVDWLGTCVHGSPFVAGFRCGALAGCQFHPEKSGETGLALLAEMLAW